MYAGLNRTEVVDRITRRGAAAQSLARRAQVLSELLNYWHTEPGYAGVYDIAREIPHAADEGKPSFAALARKVSPDSDPEELLADLDASKCIEHLDGGFIRPLTRAYVLPPGDVARIDRMGKVLLNFTEAFARGIVREPGQFSALAERTLVSDFAVSDQGLQRFNDEVRERGTKLLTDLDSWLTAQGGAVASDEGSRYGCGLYVFEDVAFVGRSPIEIDELDPFESSDSDVRSAPVVVDVLDNISRQQKD